MSQYQIDVSRIKELYGDRVLVRRLGAPEKKRGLYVPAGYANKKEPSKVWFGRVVAFGKESKAQTDFELAYNDIVGIEPIGHNYATFIGTDNETYLWVPDEHLCLLDDGSIAKYLDGTLDAKSTPQVRIIGSRYLVRPAPIDEHFKGSKIIRPDLSEEREVKISETVLGRLDDIPVGSRVVHVTADSGSSSVLDIFDPALVVLRAEDIIGELSLEKEAVA